MPLRVFMVTGTPYGSAARDRGLEDLAEQPALPGQRAAAALAGHLGHRAAEVQVDVRDAVLVAQDLGGLADVRPGRRRRAAPSGPSSVSSKASIRSVVSSRSTRPRDVIISQT